MHNYNAFQKGLVDSLNMRAKMGRHCASDSPNALLPPEFNIEEAKNNDSPIAKYRVSSGLQVKGFQLNNE
jgi:hypothetical protein